MDSVHKPRPERWRWIVGLGLLLSIAVFGFPSREVHACSLPPRPNLEAVRAGEPLEGFGESSVTGVYEYEHLARSPIGLGDRSVTVVTRYWGEPPDDVGLRVVTSDCGEFVADGGMVGYWWVSESARVVRSSWTFADTTEGLTAAHGAQLVDEFGAPRPLGVTTLDRIGAILLAWQWVLIMMAAGSVAIAGFARRYRRHTPPTPS